jgi:hypothetical protein
MLVLFRYGAQVIWVFRKNLSFYFSLYFEGSPQQKIPRELHGGGNPVIFLHSHVPMERFFDGTDQENSKKNKKQRMDERKRRNFDIRGGSHTHVFSIGQERPCATLPQENLPYPTTT